MPKKIPLEKIERICELAKERLSDSEIARRLRISRSSVGKYRRSFGIPTYNFLSPEIEELIVSEYLNGIPMHKLRSKYRKDFYAIRKILEDHGISKLSWKTIRADKFSQECFFLYKIAGLDFGDILEIMKELYPKYKWSLSKIREYVGRVLQDICRSNLTCPFKPLLPNSDVRDV